MGGDVQPLNEEEAPNFARLFAKYCGSNLCDEPGRDPQLDKGRDESLHNMLSAYQRANLNRGDNKWGSLRVLVSLSLCCIYLSVF